MDCDYQYEDENEPNVMMCDIDDGICPYGMEGWYECELPSEQYDLKK